MSLAAQDGRLALGSDDREDTEQGRIECAASATLKALEVASEQQFRFELLEAERYGHFNCVLARISAVAERGKTYELIGSCLIDASEVGAAIKAVLNGTNRIFETDFMFMKCPEGLDRKARAGASGVD